MKEWVSHSAEETMEWGRELGSSLQGKVVICFFGDLASGKTTFIKGLVEGAAQVDSSLVQSPTFVYLHIYKGEKTVYHFDLYRLRDSDAFLSMGFEEYLESDGICCIEWSERIKSLLPDNFISVTLTHEGENKRRISIETQV